MNILSVQGFSAEAPVPFLDLIDFHQCVRTQCLAFDRDHGVSHFFNNLLLLCRSERVFDYFNIYEWHFVSFRLRGQMNDDELDVEMLMYDLQRRIDASQLPGGRTVIKFLFRALPKFGHWWIVIEADGTRVLCVQNPRLPVDIELITDLRTMSHVWAGD